MPLSAFVEVYIEVQDVNDNVPQTDEPVYYPSVMENSPKDVSIIQINAVDPDAKASDKLTYKITSGNPQGFFTINAKTGKNAIPVMDIHVTLNCIFIARSSWNHVTWQMNVTTSKNVNGQFFIAIALFCFQAGIIWDLNISNASSKAFNH